MADLKITSPFYHNLKKGDLAYHPKYGIVKFESYHGWTTYVLTYNPKCKRVNDEKIRYWEWDRTIICTHNLKEYNKSRHGEIHDFTNRLK